jgi:hypothetical protein
MTYPNSPEAMAFFHGTTINKAIPRLAQIATAHDPRTPFADLEVLNAELKADEKRLHEEVAELQLRG